MGTNKGNSSSIAEVRKSPKAIFEKARENKQGIYIYNQEEIAGVMLTIEQYESLLKETNHLEKNDQKIQLDLLNQAIRETVNMGAIISSKNLDESLVALGFISKKKEEEDYAYIEMMNEITETGKIEYQLRKKEDRRTIIAEVIGEQTNKVQMFDKLLVKKIHLRVE